MDHRLIVSVLVGLAAACGAAGTEPHDMSADEHRAAAREHHAEGERGGVHTGAAARSGTEVHDRGTPHHHAAEQHETAAEALDTQRAAACEGIPDEAARTCAFHGTVADVRYVEGGVAFVLREPGLTAAAVERRALCHHAHMAQQGLESMARCPFGIRDLTVRATDASGGVVLVLTTLDGALVNELRARARGMVALSR